MKIKLTLILIALFPLNLFSQLTIKITSSKGFDTTKTCEDTLIKFYADVRLNNVPLDSFEIYWDFGDGDFLEGNSLDTVEHSYIKHGGYRVFAYVKKDSLYAYDIHKILIGLKPDFSETKTNLGEDEGLCKGDEVVLTGDARTYEWKEKFSFVRQEIFPVFIDTQYIYNSTILIKNFSLQRTIDTSLDISIVGVKMEHSAAQDIRITLMCPCGKKIILKDFGGNAQIMGNPVSNPDDYSEGTGFWYYWSDTAGIYMNDYSQNDTLPSDVYKPQQSFGLLKDCPLNGIWQILVEQNNNNSSENGYAFGWQINFNDTIKKDTLKFSNSYLLQYSAWLGDDVNVTSNGVASAFPQDYGDHRYYFYVKDNYGCLHDTSIFVNVEKPDFELDKYSVFIGDSIKVEDKTTWTAEREWDFGDESEIETEETVFHKYYEKDTFLIKMTVFSKSGCSDFDTAKVVVVPKPIEIQDYNIFTPNGDGVNDVFSFFNTPDEKIIAANIETIKGRIYNRYGEVVCRWDSAEEAIKGWDGTINNDGIRKAPPGFYYYVLIIKGKDGKKYEPFSGVIYLYRTK